MRVSRIGIAMIALSFAGFAISVALKQSDSIAIVALVYASAGMFLAGIACWLVAIARWPRQRP